MVSSPATRFRLAAAASALPVLLHGLLVMPRFDGLYGQDPYAYLAYGTGPLRDWLGSGGPLPPFHWPPGFPLLVALVSLVVGPTARAGQLVALLAAAVVPPATAVLARGLDCSRRTALLAAGLVALTGQLWQSSVVVMSDTPSLAALVWGAAGVVWWSRRGDRSRGWHLVGGAALLGFAILCRWAAALAVLPLIALAASTVPGRGWRRHLTVLLAGGLAGAAVLSPLLAPTIATLSGRAGPDPSFTVDFGVAGWNAHNILSRRFTNLDGTQEYRLPNLLYLGLAPARRALLSPLGALLMVPGLLLVLAAPRRDRLLVLVGWPAVVLGFLVGTTYQNFRYLLLILSPLAVVAAIGADRLLAARRSWLRWATGALLAGAASWMVWGGVSLTRWFVTRQEATLAVVDRVVATVPTDARVVAFGLTLAIEHDGRREAVELYHQDGASLAALLAGSRPVYLAADLAVVRGQWGELSPGTALRWLEAHARLVPLWTMDGVTLLAVEPGDPA